MIQGFCKTRAFPSGLSAFSSDSLASNAFDAVGVMGMEAVALQRADYLQEGMGLHAEQDFYTSPMYLGPNSHRF